MMKTLLVPLFLLFLLVLNDDSVRALTFQLIEPLPSLDSPCVYLQYFGTSSNIRNNEEEREIQCIPLRMQIECPFNTTVTWITLADLATPPFTVISQCWDPRCDVKLGCSHQYLEFSHLFSLQTQPACNPYVPYMGTLPFSITQQSCVSAILHVHIPINLDVWVIPPLSDMPPFVMPNGSLFVQPIDRVYFGNDTLRWRFLPLKDPSCLGWSVDVPMPDECVKEQTLLTYVSSHVFVSYVSFCWTLLVLMSALGTWFGVWMRYPWMGELLRVIGIYYQIPAFLSLGFSTLVFTTALGFFLSTTCILLYCLFVLWAAGKAYLTFPTRVTSFGVLVYFLYIFVFMVTFSLFVAAM
jgi:hypothetical protein